MEKTILDRAFEIFKKNPSIEFYQAIEMARREFHEKYRSKIDYLRNTSK